MNLSYRRENGVSVVKAHAARLDAAVAIQFKDRFSEVTGQGSRPVDDADGGTPLGEGASPRTVILDMSEIEFLDSSGLGAVVAARKQLGSDRVLALAGLQPAVEKVMRLTHMDRVFPILATTADILSPENTRGRTPDR